MGGKGGKKRKGGGVPTPGFGAGGRGGPSGGLPSPSPTPSMGGWETEEDRFGGGGVPSAREAGPKVPRVGAASSVADVGGLVAEMSQLRLRLGGPSQGLEVLLFNLVSPSGLALPLRRTLSELVEEVVECRVVAEKREVARLKELLFNDEVSSDLALKLVEAQKGWAEEKELAEH